MEISDIPQKCTYFQYGFENFEIWRYAVPGDMHCFFHSVLLGYCTQYRIRKYNVNGTGLSITRLQIVEGVRKTLAEKVSEYYTTLGEGAYPVFAKESPEFRLDNLQKKIAGKYPVGLEVLELCTVCLKLNIFILDLRLGDVYITGIEASPKYTCVVLLYTEIPLSSEKLNPKLIGHFELCGVSFENKVITHFQYENPFIQLIRQRISQRKNG